MRNSLWYGGAFRQPYVKRNFLANLFDGGLFAFGMSFVANTTVLPVFVKELGGSNLVVGLIPVVWIIGFNVPQVFVANFTQRFAFKKALFLRTGLIQRMPWLILAAVAMFAVGSLGRDWTLVLFFFAFAMAAVGGSINLPAWFDLIAKVTPLQLRGRLFAGRAMLGALLGVVGGFVATKLLDQVAFPQNFAYLFLTAFGLFMVSYIFLLFLKENDPNPALRQLKQADFFRQLPGVLKQGTNFRNFLIADALLMMALMADAFYTVHAIDRFGLSLGYAGQFTMVMMVSVIVGNLVFGAVADKLGHKINLFVAAFSTVFASGLAALVSSIALYHTVFIFAALTTSLTHISRLTIVAELCDEVERPTYVALANLVSSPFILSAVLGGWLADRLGYDVVFSLAVVLALASAFWLLTTVDEPRKRPGHVLVPEPQVNV